MMRSTPWRMGALVALTAACSDRLPDLSQRDRTGGVASVVMTTMGDRGTPAAPRPFSADGVTYTVRLEARGANGQRNTSFNGFLALSVQPGIVRAVRGEGATGNYVQLRAGLAENVEITVSRAYGETRLWAEEDGYLPVDPQRTPRPSCGDGVDNDRDGFVDYPADQGCAAPNDDTELGGSYVVGTSEPMFFASPLISDVQGHGGVSPLLDARVTIQGRVSPAAPMTGERAHRLVVTQTDNSGFFVTDIDDVSCGGMPCFNHLYSFNFRAPDGMRPCDILATLTGSVAEFVSSTQLAQPGYEVGVAWRPNDPAVGECQIPDAVELSATALTNAESLESGLVRATDVVLPTVMGPGLAPGGIAGPGATNCDLNGDGRITYDGGMEDQCATACQGDPACSEWSNWARYGQVTVTLPGMGATTRVAIAPKPVNPNFDPVRPRGPTATVTGTLRQVGPNWIIQPRCGADFVVAGDGQTVRRAREVCLHERSEGEE